ncbi:hypothetical protein KKI24_09575 [bacterium]|nr:hypothetical protein [bacterium]
MKKSVIKVLLPVLSIFLISSCGINTVKVKEYKQTKRVALISVYSQDSVDTKAVSGNPLLAFAVKAVQGNNGTDMLPKMNGVKAHILKEAPSIFGFEMIPEKQVINLKSYKAYSDSSKDLSNLVAPEGYKRIFPDEKEIITKVLSQIKGADAAMIFHLNARAGESAIPGKAVIRVSMTFTLVNKNGEQILQKTVDEEADGSISCVKGIFNGGELGKKVVESIDKDLKAVSVWIKEELKKPQKG